MTPHPVTSRLVDVGLAVGLAAVLWLRVAAPFEADASPPDWRAWVLAGLLGGVLLVRRRRPVGVLLVSLGLLLLYYLLGFGAIGAVEPLAVALYTVAVHGRWRVGAMVAGALVAGSGIFRLTVEHEALTAGTLADVLNDAVLAAALLLAGAMVRSHRSLRAAVRQREAALRAEAEAQQRQRLSEQRLAIARDVHDVVAHALAAVGVHARLATEVLDDRGAPRGDARELVAGIGEVTRDALSDLRRTVGDLRTRPAVDGLEDLVARTVGVQVELRRPNPPPAPDPRVEQAVLAVVREALTNVVRHAEATTAQVVVEDGEDATTVTVRDNGRATDGGSVTPGHGLTGMHERLSRADGTLTVATPPEGGVEVVARIPATALPAPTAADVGGAG